MTVELKLNPPKDDLLYILDNLRERDRQEIYATRWDEDADALANELCAMGEFRWAAYLDGRPVAAIGAAPRWPGVWSVWAFGTDDWNKVILTLTRHVRDFMIPAIHYSGFHRADCLALETHEDARKWLTFLGGEQEEKLDNWGKNGENFVVYRWSRETTLRLIHERRSAPRQFEGE